jgi:Tfp pilus assembly PilM family ATPase
MKLDKQKIKSLYGAVIKKISPIGIAGGLVVSDSAIRYLRFNESGAVVSKASLRLPPGAIEGGKIVQNDVVVGALTALRDRINVHPSRGAEVIFSLDSGAVYSQIFNLPQLEESSLAEAAELNIQMISPIDTKTSYYSYQVVGRPESVPTGGYELLGAFIGKAIIDDWIAACKKSGFLPIAFEFQALSVVRAISEVAGISSNDITLILDVSSEGMDLIIIKNKNLYFDYFYPWKMIQGEDKSISTDKFKQILAAETAKVMNFALSKFSGEIKSIWVSAEGIGEEMVSEIKKQHPSISVAEISAEGKKVPPLWLSALGAAKRGTLLRSEDNLISLSPQRVVEEYAEYQTIAMVKLWRRISSIVLLFFLFAFCLSDLFLRQVRLSAGQQSLRSLSPEESRELSLLRGQADEFNSLVTFVGGAKAQENNIYPLVSKILNLGSNVQITRLSFQGVTQPVVLNGNAPSADAVIQFQKRLAEVPNITEIQFPLSSLTTAPNGRTAFVMSFRIISLDSN